MGDDAKKDVGEVAIQKTRTYAPQDEQHTYYQGMYVSSL